MTTDFPLKVLIRFWAKTTHNKAHYPNAYHPLICHMIDVAVVTELMWNKVLSKAAKIRIARAFGLPTDTEGLKLAGRIVAWIAGLHDLGKASPPFTLRGFNEKNKKNSTTFNLLSLYKGTPFYPQDGSLLLNASDAPHGYVTAATLKILLEDIGVSETLAKRIADLIGAHHGTFASVNDLKSCKGKNGAGEDHWGQARRDIVRLMMELFEVKEAVTKLTDSKLDAATTMMLAGLVSVADWVGSNSTYFPCIVRDMDLLRKANSTYWQTQPLERYLKRANKRANRALGELGWLGWPEIEESAKTFEELFEGKSPRPLQHAAIALADKLEKKADAQPALIVIEDEMGKGKTETAIFLADFLSVKLGQRGIYFALPTMATSNQMFGRVCEYLTLRFPGVKVPIQLLHGHATLQHDFKELVKQSTSFLKFRGIYCDQVDGQCDGSLLAAEWFTSNKKGLLVPFGVGTVDQAMMAALRTRHVFVRLFGLAHRTVIIDEVHAYDAYMSKVLERLLEWLGALQSPVILLSATLPSERRQAFMNAYASGLQQREVNYELPESDYPRITWTTGAEPEAIAISDFTKLEEKGKSRELVIELTNGNLQDEQGKFPLGERLKEQLKAGGCAVVICNTVDRAQQVYLALRDGNYFSESELDLFHARFTFEQREKREELALERFGKNRTKRPQKFVLVATQVVEQSLDLDFDLMVSDFAPLDLLLQRSGRLWRHAENTNANGSRFGMTQPTMWVCQPEMKDDAPRFDAGTEAVYSPYSDNYREGEREFAPFVLLRSWLALIEKGKLLDDGKCYLLSIPDDIESVIEATYKTIACPEHITGMLRVHWEKGEEEYKNGIEKQYGEAADRRFREPWNQANFGDWFKFQVEEDSPDSAKLFQALTRLGDSIGIICLNESDGFNPDKKPTPKQTEKLLKQSVTVSRKGLVYALRAEPIPKGWKKSPLLRHYRAVTLNKPIAKHIFQLDEKLGLLIEKTEKGNRNE
jgi:CRISPR-associated endonuclease/helicase Cas3